MDSCAICLEDVAGDSQSRIYVESNEWKKLNTSRIIEKHLWWWHLKHSTSRKCSYICGECWKMLSSFHDFYLEVKKAHQLFDAQKWPILKGKCYRQDSRDKSKKTRENSKQCIKKNNELNRLICSKKSKIISNCSDDNADARNGRKSNSKTEFNDVSQSGHQLSCDLCNIALKGFSELKTHYRIEHNMSGYAMCCNKKFYNRGQYTDHLMVHENPNYFKCSFCSRVLSHRFSYENHLKGHQMQSIKQIFACDECKEPFCDKDDYERHILSHSQDNRIMNNVNLSLNNVKSEEFLSDNSSRSRTSFENVDIEFYNTSIDETNNLRDIVEEATIYDETVANSCQNYFINTEIEESFPVVKSESDACFENIQQIIPDIYVESNSTTGQNEHINVSPNTETKDKSTVVQSESVICSENGEIFNYTFIDEDGNCSNNVETSCGEISTHENDLRFDKSAEINKDIYKNSQICKADEEYLKRSEYTVTCHICSSSFINFFELKSHCRLEHNTNGFAMCCNKKMYNSSQFADHLRVHENPNYFECTICQRTFSYRAAYETHIKSHKARKAQKVYCEICKKKFSNKTILYCHQNNMHAIEMQKEQTCAYCSKVSPNMHAHRAHIRYNHTQGLKHACQLCEKKFSRPFHLREHLSTHTGVPLHACPYCARPFNSIANMHTHRKRVHPKEWTEDRIKKLAREKLKKYK